MGWSRARPLEWKKDYVGLVGNVRTVSLVHTEIKLLEGFEQKMAII